MMSLIGRWILDWLIGWGGLSLLVAIGAGAVWWFIPAIFTKVRALAFNVAIGALAYNFVYTMGYQHGASVTKTAWEEAEQRERDRGRDIREQAEQDIPPVVDEPTQACEPQPGSVAPVPKPRAPAPQWMRNDGHNRDNR